MRTAAVKNIQMLGNMKKANEGSIERKDKSESLNPYQLLVNTFNPNPHTKQINSNVLALARVYQVIGEGDLSVNGLPPDMQYPLGEYLIHGGRVRFDLTDLSKGERDVFFNYILNQDNNNPANIKKRKFATHRRGGIDASGHIAEIKSGLWGAILDLFTPKSRSRHLGIDLPIGGEGTGDANKPVRADGQWGHMYIYDDHADGFMMVGIEPSGMGQHNLRTGEVHSKIGAAGELSPFLAKKINDKSLHADQEKAGQCALSTKGKYNWSCVKVTRQTLQALCEAPVDLEDANTRDNFKASLKNGRHKNAVKMDPEQRKVAMVKWQKATAKTNSVSKWALIGGITLSVIGLVLSLSPFPPGVSQAIGTALTAFGIKTALGIGLTTAATGMLGGAGIASTIRKKQAVKAVATAAVAHKNAMQSVQAMQAVQPISLSNPTSLSHHQSQPSVSSTNRISLSTGMDLRNMGFQQPAADAPVAAAGTPDWEIARSPSDDRLIAAASTPYQRTGHSPSDDMLEAPSRSPDLQIVGSAGRSPNLQIIAPIPSDVTSVAAVRSSPPSA